MRNLEKQFQILSMVQSIWGKYRVFGKTIIENGQIITATSPLSFYKGQTLVKTQHLLKRVDLGTLNWNVIDQLGVFNSLGIQNETFYGAKLVCVKYKSIDFNDLYSRTKEGVSIATNNGVWIYDTSKAGMSAQEFKNAVSGIILYYEPIEALTLSGIGTAKDSWHNYNGSLNKQIGSVNLGSLNWISGSAQSEHIRWASSGVSGVIKAPTDSDIVANIQCDKYKPLSSSQTYILENGISIRANNGYIEIYDSSKETLTAQEFKNSLNGVILYFEKATPTTETINSLMLPKGITKITDANGLELEFEVLNDPNNFSNKNLMGKNAPTVTAEKVITKGFTSGDEHFTQLYIYDDGEIWYVNSQGSAQAFASGVWEIEYKQIQFDSGVQLNTSERNALLSIYDLI